MGHIEETALRNQLTAATKKVEELTKAVLLYQQVPRQVGRVIRQSDGGTDGFTSWMAVVGSSPAVLVMAPDDAQLSPGDWVVLVDGGIVGSLSCESGAGLYVTVQRCADATTFDAETSAGLRRYIKPADMAVEEGDRVVVLDEFAVVNLGKDSKSFVADTTSVSWEDIGGQGDAKLALQEIIELPYKYPELFARYGKKLTKGVLLHGPTGTGKTLLGKAAATALAATRGKSASTGFIYVKGPEILSKWVGESESSVRALFAQARAHKAKHGYPAVVFIDEAEAILGKRGSRETASSLGSTIVPMFLAEMDGFEDSGAVVVLATNRPDSLDTAVVREGRVDHKVYVGRPTASMAEEIFKIHLRSVFTAGPVEELAKVGVQHLYDPSHVLWKIHRKSGEDAAFTLGNIASGAMIAGMCQHAATQAVRRDIAAGGEATGVCADDFALVAKGLWKGNLHIDHESDIAHFIHPFKGDVTGKTQVSI